MRNSDNVSSIFDAPCNEKIRGMGLLNSKRDPSDASKELSQKINNGGVGKFDGENRLLSRKQKIAYVNQHVSTLRNYTKIPEYLLVRKKKTTLLVDSDGCVANVFLETVADEKDGSRMRLVPKTKGLQPLEFVEYNIPRLDYNLNLVLWEAPK